MHAGSDIEKALTEAQQKIKLNQTYSLQGMRMEKRHQLDVRTEDEYGLEESVI